jgi:hypothetical protein
MSDSLTRADIVDALRDLVTDLHAGGEVAGIRLVGGAALVLRYFDRRTTSDLDSLHIHPGSDDVVLAAAGRVADRRGWASGWFNFAVENADSIPVLGRRTVVARHEASRQSAGARYGRHPPASLALRDRLRR